jgi:hypothetical protein
MSKRTTRFSLLDHLNRSRRAARRTNTIRSLGTLESLESRQMLASHTIGEDTSIILPDPTNPATIGVTQYPNYITSIALDPGGNPTSGTVEVLDASNNVVPLGSSAVRVRYTPLPNVFNNDGVQIAPQYQFVVNQFGGGSETEIFTVTSINDAPVINGTSAISVNEHIAGSPTSTTTTSVQVNDVDAGAATLGTITLTATKGNLSLTGNLTNGVPTGNISGNGTGSITISGVNQNQLNVTLANGLVYSPLLNQNGADSIVITANDGGNSGAGGAQTGTGTISVTINAVNSPPVVTATSPIGINEDVASAANFAGILISDADAGTNDLTVSLSLNQGGKLTVTGGGAGVPTGDISGNNSSSITMTGTLTELNNTINTLIYQGALNFNGTEKLTVVANDLGHNPGPAATGSKVIDIVVAAVNDAPVLTVPGAQTADEQVPKPLPGVSLADLDVGAGSLTVTVTTSGSGTVSATGGGSIVGSGTGTMTISGTLPAVNAALANLAYTSDELGATLLITETVTIVANDNGNTGIGGNLTDTKTIAVTVSAVNDAPVVTLPASYTVAEDAGAALFSPVIQATDADLVGNPVLGITATVSVNQGGTLTIPGVVGIVNLTPASGSTIGFTGALAAVQSALAGITYTPAGSFNGTETLTVTVVDNGNFGSGGVKSDTKSTPINVLSVNDPPSFTVPASTTVLEDTGANSIGGFATAISPGPANEASQSVTFNVTGVGTPSLFTATGQPTLSPTGTLAFTLAPNAFGSSTVTVVAKDNGGTANGGVDTSAPQTFTINVTNVNDQPTFTAVSPPVYTPVAGPQTFAVVQSANAGPNEGSQTLTGKVISVSNPALFSLVNGVAPGSAAGTTFGIGGGIGTLGYTLTGAVGTSTVQIQVTDNGGTANGGVDASTIQTIVIQVQGTNVAPSIAGPATASTPEETPLVFNTTNGNAFTVTDPDAGPNLIQLTLQVLDQTAPTPNAGKGTITLGSTAGIAITGGSNGSKSMTLLGTTGALTAALNGLTYLPPTNFVSSPVPSLNDIIRMTANDLGNTGTGGALTTTKDVSVTVTPVNDPVVLIQQFADIVDNEDTTGNPVDNIILVGNSPFVGSAYFADPDASDPVPQIIGLSVSSSNPSLVVGTVDPAGAIRLDYQTFQSGTANITVTATDAFGSTASDTFQVTINPVNTPVIANNTTSFRKDTPFNLVTVPEDFAPFSQQLISPTATTPATTTSVFTDNDLPNETLTYVVTTSPGGIVTAVADTTNNLLTISPVPNANGGPVTVTVQATDSFGATATSSLQVTVTSVNDPPVANNDAYTIAEDSGTVALSVLANDTPGPANESGQTISIVGIGGTGPANGTAVISSASTISYTPNPGFYGTDSFTYQIQDNGAPSLTSAFATVTITVTPVNDAPVITAPTPAPFPEDTSLALAFIDIADDIPGGTGTNSSSVVTVDLTNPNGTFAIDPAPGVAVTNIANGRRLTGPVSAINATLDDVDTKFTPTLDFNTPGATTTSLSIVVNDGGNIGGGTPLTATMSVPLSITPVNDAPSLVLNPSPVIVPQHSGAAVQSYTFASFVQQRLPAGHLPTPADEAGQVVTFTAPTFVGGTFGLISNLVVNATTGQLTFDVAPNSVGSATFQTTVSDNGSPVASSVQSFTINVGINQGPLFDLVGNAPTPVQDVNVAVNSGTSQFPDFLRHVQTGPAGTDSPAGQVIQSVSVTNDNNALFTIQPQIINFLQPSLALSGEGDLLFAVAPGAFGVANVTVTLVDSGGTANGGTNSTSKTFKITVGTGIVDAIPPRVTDVRVGSSAWQPTFLAEVGGVGYSIPDGADQAKALPWTNVNRIFIDFSEPVKGSGAGGTLTPIDMPLHGTTSGMIMPSSVSFDASNNRATLILPSNLAADKYLLVVDANNVTDNAGNKLDGEWTNYVSTISGNGAAGGQFLYRFNILPGDANQSASVTISDLAMIAANFGAVAGGSGYSILRDVNGSGTITISDLAIVASSFGTTLPAGNPLGIPAIAASVDSLFDNSKGFNHTEDSKDLDLAIDDVASSVASRGSVKSRGAFLG